MKLNGKKIFVCLLFFAFLILLTNATYAAVDFSLNQTSVVLNDGASFEFQIRISDIDAEARSFSGSMNFNDEKIRLDSISGLGSNWQLEGRNLALGTFFMTRANDEAASSNEAVIKVTGTVIANQCEETITITDLRYTDINDVQLSAGRVLGFFVKKNAGAIDITVQDDNYQSGGQSIFDIIDTAGSTGSNNGESSGSLIPENNQNENTSNGDTNNANNTNDSNNYYEDLTPKENENTNNQAENNNNSNTGNTDNTGNTNNNKQTTNAGNKTTAGTTQKDSTVTPAGKAPQTGTGKFVVIALISVVVIGSVCYVGFRKNNF